MNKTKWIDMGGSNAIDKMTVAEHREFLKKQFKNTMFVNEMKPVKPKFKRKSSEAEVDKED